jgi:hypothetical protein
MIHFAPSFAVQGVVTPHTVRKMPRGRFSREGVATGDSNRCHDHDHERVCHLYASPGR